jgi:chorismate mutase
MEMRLTTKALLRLRARRREVEQDIGEICVDLNHIDDHDLERYHLGMVRDEAELLTLEEHLICCNACVDRAEAAAQYVDTIRVAIIKGDFDIQ